MTRPARVYYEPGWPWEGPWPWCPKAEWTDDKGVIHPAIPHDAHITNGGNTHCPGVHGMIEEDV
jgi:hypothetical protein